jgi:hypothetical protein
MNFLATASVEDLAIHGRTWSVDAAEHEALAGEIADEVEAWLDGIGPASP